MDQPDLQEGHKPMLRSHRKHSLDSNFQAVGKHVFRMRTPKRLKGKQSPAHARAPQQEREIAKRIGGRVTPGSGAGAEKADVRKRGVVRLEAKTTSHKSYSLTRALADRLEEVALTHDEIPFFEIEFLEGGKPAQALCVMPKWALEQIVGSL